MGSKESIAAVLDGIGYYVSWLQKGITTVYSREEWISRWWKGKPNIFVSLQKKIGWLVKFFCHTIDIFFLNFIYLLIGCIGFSSLCAGPLQLHWAGATLCCGALAPHCSGLSCGAQAPDAQASAAVAHGLSRSAACGILPDQGSNPRPLHWQADSQPLRHQGSPDIFDYCRTHDEPSYVSREKKDTVFVVHCLYPKDLAEKRYWYLPLLVAFLAQPRSSVGLSQKFALDVVLCPLRSV